MDAISFVLGINSNQLRSNQLVDLINRKSDSEFSILKSTSSCTKRSVKNKGAQKSSVTAFYMNSKNENLIFTRT